MMHLGKEAGRSPRACSRILGRSFLTASRGRSVLPHPVCLSRVGCGQHPKGRPEVEGEGKFTRHGVAWADSKAVRGHCQEEQWHEKTYETSGAVRRCPSPPSASPGPSSGPSPRRGGSR